MNNTQSKNEEKDLIARLKRGDEAAMKSLFRQYYLRLLYFTIRVITNRHDAEDLVQEALMNFWINVSEKGATPDNIQQYLYRMVRNRCINYLQRQKKDQQFDDTATGLFTGDMEQQLDELQVKEELYQRIAKALNHLTPSQMEVINGMYLQGLSVQQMAEQMNTTPNNVRNHKARAIERLREVIDTELFLSFLLFLKISSDLL